MKNLITKVLIVIIGFLIVDFAVGFWGSIVIERLNQKNYSGQAALLGYNLQKATADVVVIGGSTASCHLIPTILSDSLSSFVGDSLSAFNAGAYYQQPSYSYCELKSILERKKPKYVFVEIQPQQLGGETVVEALKPLRPYYAINKNVREILDDNESWSNKVLLNLNMFRFNTEFFKLISSFRNPVGADGFDPKEGRVGSFVIKPEKDNNDLNEVVTKEFEEMLNIANNNSIQLFVLMSPRLVYTDKESLSYKKIVELCSSYKVPLFDLTTDAEFVKGELFCDNLHLNPQGAELFTKRVCSMVKHYLIN